ncbi:MAG: MFS transporter [Oscillospiraceae bacterium]|nr:MFS transporter [Oscillospiraceae bacterium]
MAKQTLQEKEQPVQTNDEQPEPPKFRRTVSFKETFGLVAFESARDMPFRIGNHQEWLDRTLRLNRALQGTGNIVVAIGDIFSDLILATAVEKIRTRWGKFRPLLLAFSIYAPLMSVAMAMLPVFFWEAYDPGGTLLTKLVLWVILRIFNDLADTLWNIATIGMIANITADPEERLSLITKARFFSVGSSPINTLRDFVADVISRRPAYTTAQRMAQEVSMRRMFAGFGIGTVILGGLLGIYFASVSKERVIGVANIQKQEKPPTFRESLSALKGNRPLLMIVLHEMLEGVRVNDQMGTYTSAILDLRNFGTLYGIPGAIISPISYSYIGKLRRVMSTKVLWVVSRSIGRPILILIYFFGMIPTRGTYSPGGQYRYYRMYARIGPMIAVYMVYDMVRMTFWGAAQVIPDEIRNEVIDYGEWKNGFRSEAMVGMLRGVPSKIMGIIGRAVTDFIMHWFGFRVGADFQNQPPDTADGIWLMTTLIPQSFALLATIPQFFYNIGKKERAVMYAELGERRHAALQAQKEYAREIEEQFEQRDDS